MKPLSIRTGLTAWFVGLTFLLLLAFSAVLYASVSRTLHDGLDKRLETTARGLAALADWEEKAHAVEIELSKQLAAQQEASHPEMSQEVWDWPDQWSVHRSGKAIDVPLPDASFGQGVDLTACPAVVFSTIDTPEGARRLCTLLHHCAPSPEDLEDLEFDVLVRVAEDLAPVQAQLAQLAWVVVILAAISAAVVLIFGVLISRRVIRPLKELGKAATAIRAGRAVKLPRRGTGDEVDDLGEILDEAFSRLEDALQRQTRFTSDAAHELRNPIAVIRNAAEIALRRKRSPDEYRDFFGDVLATAKRMGQVVEALLLLARLDAGQAASTFEKVDLVAVAHDSATAQPLAGGRVSIEGKSPAFVEGDEGLLRVLIDNLLSNALRYSGREAPVNVTVVNSDGVTLSVKDEGPGIPSDAVGRVFDRFYRIESANPDVPGAGLGLALVSEVARVHSVESRIDTSQGGTCVIVKFPSAPPGD